MAGAEDGVEERERAPGTRVSEPSEPSEPPPSGLRRLAGGAWSLLRRYGRWLLFAAGVGAVVLLVRDAGPDQVWATLLAAGPWLPLIILCEIGFVGMDVVSLRLMLGAAGRRVPGTVWLHSGMIAYGIMVLFPAGRAGGEVARAASLSPYVGGARAAAGAALLQGATMWGNTLITIPCLVAVGLTAGLGTWLGALVGLNGLVTAVLGSAIFFGARYSRIGGFLGRRIRALGAHGTHFDRSLRQGPSVPVRPIVAALVGRTFQSLQYGLILAAVAGSATVVGGLTAQAIHLVGAGLGDVVPNAAGITEMAYRIFREVLGLTMATAVSIALVHRLAQYSLAGTSLLVGAIWHPGEAPRREADLAAGRSEEPA
ncbi:MAG: lysylphosphatidylglycerol synthase domain-containing protein [Sandaracinaceae bacterium]